MVGEQESSRSPGSKDSGCICIECGYSSHCTLYREFTGGAIQLTQCPNCHQELDKYVEFDPVILILDVLLLRIQAYRHLLFHFGLSTSILWKLSFFLVVCEAYSKLRSLPYLSALNTVLLQVNFHAVLVQSALEFICTVLSAYLMMRILVWSALSPKAAQSVSLIDVLRAVVISSYGRLCALAAVVWTGDFYLGLPIILVLPAQMQAFRALLGTSSVVATTVTVLHMSAMYGASTVLSDWRAEALLGITGNPFLPAGQHHRTLQAHQ